MTQISDDVLADITQRIVEVAKPDKLMLFGSRARGDAREAANNVLRTAPDFAVKYPDVPWNDAYLLRNQVAHGYFKVDLELVWRTIFNDLPDLKIQILGLCGNAVRPN